MTAAPAAGRLRILFDPQIFCHQRFGGVSRYVCSMATELMRLDDMQPLISAPWHFNEHLQHVPPALVHGRPVPWLQRAWPAAYALSMLAARLDVSRFRPQVVHRTYYLPPLRPRGTRSVLTVYDMIHEKFPEYFGRRPPAARLKRHSLASADHVICISESTRRDLLALTGFPEERVSVTHLGFDPLDSLAVPRSGSDFRAGMLGADCPYILFVGSRSAYKNFSGLLGAYAASSRLRRDFMLLCFGGGAFTAAERAAIAGFGLGSRVRQTGGGDPALAACYAHAALYVCPSYYEGFGIPPLEAMSLDCPVACSNTSSLPEVVGDAAVLFEPRDQDSIRHALESILGSPSALAALRERGRIRRTQFSWRACAEGTARVYRRLCAG